MAETVLPSDTERGILVLSDLSAGYGGRPVVSGIDLTLRRGDLLGLLGANGSGKSTLIKAMTGQIRQWAGTITIDGIDLVREPEKAKAQFGLAIDVSDLPASLSGRQYLDLVASLRKHAPADWLGDDLVKRLCLGAWLDRPIAEYSLGTRAKVATVAALIGLPPLLIFDESLNGLDPVAAWEVKTVLARLASSGKHAIIISTHVVETVPSLCNRAVFLADGAIVESWGRGALASVAAAPGGFEACVMDALRQYGMPGRDRIAGIAAA
jgi:ABC-2 type transport system ATP-binding protein